MHDLLGYGLALEGLGVAADTLTWGNQVVQADLYLAVRNTAIREQHDGHRALQH
jgi:hypothetical protein